MSYTVLARKYRSQNFDEVIGQSAVTTTLKNAIQSSRVHHGYLFCGTRGTGKTSMARILAKCLNCLKADAPTTQPCEECESCVNVARGEDIDVIEIDAASNTGVDDIRELRGNAIYMPARGRYRIYIIDEVHMLSSNAFNALLKTLEEPPGHVKFILATTDPQKVPATIQSRCQRFDFRPITADLIADRLAFICKSEKVKADSAALRRVARLANGSLRDGVSMLDQLLSVSEGKLTAEIVDEFLPVPHDERIAAVIDCLAASDPAGALAAADHGLSGGQAADQWCAAVVSHLRDLMMLRVCGAETELIDVPATVRARMSEQAQRFEPPAYVFMISVIEELRRATRYSGSSRALIEAALVRLADTAKFASIEALLSRLEGAAPVRTAGTIPGATPAVRTPGASPGTTLAAGATSSDDAGRVAAGAARSSVALPPASKKKEPQLTDAVASAADADEPMPIAPIPADHRPVAVPAVAPESRNAAPPALNIAGRPRTEEVKAMMTEPMVRQAMELFEGQLVNIKRLEDTDLHRP
ncbi:MAG: DNA polymerase III subunit gamma/tau [Phycisphaerae bacterium]|nr:DNA polymerase III subunit gamma/tau [Phycisphaerae bacterium]NUQ47648.1 DNA polymerase III subunit gamma/tau [Phycisphaerae bacterium]